MVKADAFHCQCDLLFHGAKTYRLCSLSAQLFGIQVV